MVLLPGLCDKHFYSLSYLSEFSSELINTSFLKKEYSWFSLFFFEIGFLFVALVVLDLCLLGWPQIHNDPLASTSWGLSLQYAWLRNRVLIEYDRISFNVWELEKVLRHMCFSWHLEDKLARDSWEVFYDEEKHIPGSRVVNMAHWRCETIPVGKHLSFSAGP